MKSDLSSASLKGWDELHVAAVGLFMEERTADWLEHACDFITHHSVFVESGAVFIWNFFLLKCGLDLSASCFSFL